MSSIVIQPPYEQPPTTTTSMQVTTSDSPPISQYSPSDAPDHAVNQDADDDGDVASVSSTTILSSSPLYFVLQKMLMTSTGSSLAEEVNQVNSNLHSIATSLVAIQADIGRLADAREVALERASELLQGCSDSATQISDQAKTKRRRGRHNGNSSSSSRR